MINYTAYNHAINIYCCNKKLQIYVDSPRSQPRYNISSSNKVYLKKEELPSVIKCIFCEQTIITSVDLIAMVSIYTLGGKKALSV